MARVDQVLLMRGMDVQRHSTRKNEISSRHMTPVHSLVFDTAVEFVPYVAKHCLHYGAAGSGDAATVDKYAKDAEVKAARGHGAVLVFRGEPAYPPLLSDVSDPPPFLWVCGAPEVLARRTRAFSAATGAGEGQ